MNDIKIDKGIPIPDKKVRQKKHDLPLDQMEPGDSFAIPYDREQDGYRVARLVTTYTVRRKKETGQVFTVRKLENEVRCWRVS